MAIFAVLLLGLPVGLVALLEGVSLLPLPFNLHVVDEALPIIFRVHMLASGAVLLAIPLVLALRYWPRWHRPLGRVTGLLVVLGALTSFPVAFESTSPLVARAGFVAQGLVWIALLAAGIHAARRRLLLTHQRMMLAMAAVSSGAIWTRAATAIMASYDLPFAPLYSAAAWFGWMLPMLAVLALAPRARPRLA